MQRFKVPIYPVFIGEVMESPRSADFI